MGVPPHELGQMPWWVERFALEGFGWERNQQRESPSDEWPSLAPPPPATGSLDELAGLGITVKRVG